VSDASPPEDPAGDHQPAPQRASGNPIARISRRVRTLIVAGLLFFVLLILAMTLPVPYVVLSPGPTYNTLGKYDLNGKNIDIIGIDGRTPNTTSGNLNLTTVSYSTSKLTVFDALSAWLQSDEVVVPRSSLFPPGKTTQQVNQQNTADFASSQDNAVVAASCELGYPKIFGVVSVTTHGPSDGKLATGDVFVSVDGKPADTYPKLKAVMTSEQPGTTVPVVVKRSGVTKTFSIKLGPPPTGIKTGASLGIAVPPTPECLAPFTIDLGLGNEIGGPSAGLMFALGILDKVGKTDLTKGRFIAGTGTIDSSGQVGPIGGIQLKMIAARNAGATVFLAPAGNCGDVSGATPSGLDVIKVNSLQDAVADLQKSAANQPVPHC
jgi:PDZ domain-containing protein